MTMKVGFIGIGNLGEHLAANPVHAGYSVTVHDLNPQAAAGEITVLVGGDKAVYDAHLPAFQTMGGTVMYMGPLGSASVIKVITNMLAFIHLVAAARNSIATPAYPTSSPGSKGRVSLQPMLRSNYFPSGPRTKLETN